MFQKLWTMRLVFRASPLSSPNVSKNCSISCCRVVLRLSASARALSTFLILMSATLTQRRCCSRVERSPATSPWRTLFLCSSLETKNGVNILCSGTLINPVFLNPVHCTNIIHFRTFTNRAVARNCGPCALNLLWAPLKFTFSKSSPSGPQIPPWMF